MRPRKWKGVAEGFQIKGEVNGGNSRWCRVLPRQRCGNWSESFCRQRWQFPKICRFVGRRPTDFQFFRRQHLRNLLAGRFVRHCPTFFQLGQFSRRCLENLTTNGCGPRFSRQCLENVSMREIEAAHLEKNAFAIASSKFLGQVSRKSFQRLIPVLRPRLALLDELHDAATDFPIRRRENSIDRARGLASRLFQQSRDANRPLGVIRPPRASARAGDGGVLSLGRTGFHGIRFSVRPAQVPGSFQSLQQPRQRFCDQTAAV